MRLGVKAFKLQLYWTLGHFNFVCIMEAPSEKEAIRLMPRLLMLLRSRCLQLSTG